MLPAASDELRLKEQRWGGYPSRKTLFLIVPPAPVGACIIHGIFQRVIPFRWRKPHSPLYVAEISAGRGRASAAKRLGHRGNGDHPLSLSILLCVAAT